MIAKKNIALLSPHFHHHDRRILFFLKWNKIRNNKYYDNLRCELFCFLMLLLTAQFALFFVAEGASAEFITIISLYLTEVHALSLHVSHAATSFFCVEKYDF